MINELVTTSKYVAPLPWILVLLLSTSAESHNLGSDDICLTDPGTVSKVVPANREKNLPGHFSGNASWYGTGFNGRKTASGDIFNMNKLTGAHRHLPLPTRVLVENPRNGKAAVIKVNDRGPFVKTRVMDLSREGARQIGIFSSGVGYIDCMVLPPKSAGNGESKSSSNSGDKQ